MARSIVGSFRVDGSGSGSDAGDAGTRQDDDVVAGRVATRAADGAGQDEDRGVRGRLGAELGDQGLGVAAAAALSGGVAVGAVAVRGVGAGGGVHWVLLRLVGGAYNYYDVRRAGVVPFSRKIFV